MKSGILSESCYSTQLKFCGVIRGTNTIMFETLQVILAFIQMRHVCCVSVLWTLAFFRGYISVQRIHSLRWNRQKTRSSCFGSGGRETFVFVFVWVRMIVVVLVVLCSVFDVGFHSNEICLLCSIIWALAFSEVTFESKELTICVGGDNRILLFGGGDRGTFFLFFFPLVWVMMVVTEVLCSIFVILISFLGLASHWVLRTQKFRYPLPRTHTYHSFFFLFRME